MRVKKCVEGEVDDASTLLMLLAACTENKASVRTDAMAFLIGLFDDNGRA